MTDTIATEKDSLELSITNEQVGDTIKMTKQDEKGVYNALGLIDSLHPKIYVKFANKNIGKLKASITTKDGDGNIRFNQILFPDKNADGPFGKEIDYNLKMTGEHILVIGHSLMADGQYSGKFSIRLELSEKTN